MTSPTQRRFTVVDGMILVAATAVGFGVARWNALLAAEFRPLPTLYLIRSTCLTLGFSWTFALLLLRFRLPRPPRRELCRRPGFTAGVAAAVTAVVVLFDELLFIALIKDSPFYLGYSPHYRLLISHSFGRVLNNSESRAAAAVAAVWLVSVLGGHQGSEPNGIDRAGRAMGWFWIGSALMFKVVPWLV